MPPSYVGSTIERATEHENGHHAHGIRPQSIADIELGSHAIEGEPHVIDDWSAIPQRLRSVRWADLRAQVGGSEPAIRF